MAITATHHTTDIDDTNASSYLTISRTPTANRLQIIDVVLSDTNPVLEPAVTGCGLTWVPMGGVEYDTAGTRRAIYRFRALGASPTTGQLTITATEAVSGCGWSWAEYDGIDTSGTNGSGAIVQTVTNSGSGTTLSATLAAFGHVNNGVTVGMSTDADSVFTAGSGYTILGQDVSASASPVCSIGQEWRSDNDTSPDATIPVSALWGMVASELKAVVVTAYPLGAPQYRVAFAFGVPPGTTPLSGDWVYLDRRIKTLEIVRGRNRESERMQPARCRLKLDDPNRNLEPTFAASPYYPDVVPTTPVKVECVFTTTGGSSTTYPRFVGYVDDFMPLWNAPSEVVIPCTDAMADLQAAQLRNPYVHEVITDLPAVYYRFSDPTGSTAIVDSSGNARPGDVSGTPLFGQSDPITDDQDGAALVDMAFNWFTADAAATVTGTGPFWVSAWVRRVGAVALGVMAWMQFTVSAGSIIVTLSLGTNNVGEARILVSHPSGGTVFVTGPNVADGAWHHLVGLRRADGTLQLVVDGSSAGTAAAGTIDILSDGLPAIGFNPNTFTTEDWYIDEVAAKPGADLSITRIQAHYDARNAWLGYRAGQRIDAVLDMIGWAGGATDLDVGQSTLVSAGDLEGKTALEDIQRVEEWEQGMFFLSKTGVATHYDRHHFLLNTASLATFGDATGELRVTEVVPESSASTIHNEVPVQRIGGALQVVRDATSVARYGLRTWPASGAWSLGVQSEVEALEMARWKVAHEKDPLFTIRRMTCRASDANTIVPACLGRELGDRVTVNRRPRGGTLVTDDHIVQGYTERWGEGVETKWEMVFHLSPAETQVYWILGTSQLGIDSRLAV